MNVINVSFGHLRSWSLPPSTEVTTVQSFHSKYIDSVDGGILNKLYRVLALILYPAFFT